MPKIVFDVTIPCFTVKVKGWAQGHGSLDQVRSSRSSFWHATVDIRGSALPSISMSNNPKFGAKSYFQSIVIVYVSLISGNVWIIVLMRSTRF